MNELLPNTTLSHYRIVSKIGAGGMGVVYLAEDRRLERKVAIKLLSDHLSEADQHLRRFVQEAKAASALNHPNILTIYEIARFEDSHFIATEFIKGETVRERLGCGEISMHEALDIATQSASALATAHDAQIVHRDIKPENLMIREDGLVKVLDFGLAKLMNNQEAGADGEAGTLAKVKTAPGTIMGTVAYMSPEQARGLPVDSSTDVWSLGCVLYEMLTCQQPFEGATITDVLANILHLEASSVLERRPDAPAELVRIITKTLHKDTEERYRTAKDLLADLKTLQKQMEFEAELQRSSSADQLEKAQTQIILPPPIVEEKLSGSANDANRAPTVEISPPTTDAQGVSSADTANVSIKSAFRDKSKANRARLMLLLGLLVAAAFAAGLWVYGDRDARQIESVAVLPFQNASDNPDVEYLSDGITESLINSLSQLPRLTVKARSSVFRYKGKEVEPQQVASDLAVQAVLNGRVVQHGDELSLYLALVDARTGNQLWGEQYNRKLADLVALQSEIARDVLQKLRARLSGSDAKKVTKSYTENAEAYQLYLKGRFHTLKLTLPEVQEGITYFQQAIRIDPSYALSYVGMSEAFRVLTLSGELTATEFLPKAKAAAQKAVDIDESFSEAHTALGACMFWYDWDWKAAEAQYKRALELNPNSTDAHVFYAHLLSNTGRSVEAISEIRQARELDPLSPFINTLEGQFLLLDGRIDEALARLRDVFALAPGFWFPHVFASTAYYNKGMYSEAIAEARRATELSSGQTISLADEGCGLAKDGKLIEARATLDRLLRMSTQRYVPPYHIALLYNCLGDRSEALAWLERGYQQRDPKMTFLKVDRIWDDLRSDPRFQDLMSRVGFTNR